MIQKQTDPKELLFSRMAVDNAITDEQVTDVQIYSHLKTAQEAEKVAKHYSEILDTKPVLEFGEGYRCFKIQKGKVRVTVFYGGENVETPF